MIYMNRTIYEKLTTNIFYAKIWLFFFSGHRTIPCHIFCRDHWLPYPISRTISISPDFYKGFHNVRDKYIYSCCGCHDPHETKENILFPLTKKVSVRLALWSKLIQWVNFEFFLGILASKCSLSLWMEWLVIMKMEAAKTTLLPTKIT